MEKDLILTKIRADFRKTLLDNGYCPRCASRKVEDGYKRCRECREYESIHSVGRKRR